MPNCLLLNKDLYNLTDIYSRQLQHLISNLLIRVNNVGSILNIRMKQLQYADC
jgi:hypothetical protein